MERDFIFIVVFGRSVEANSVFDNHFDIIQYTLFTFVDLMLFSKDLKFR